MSKIKLGVIGLGKRGTNMLKTILNMCKNVDVLAVCDLYEDRTDDAAALVTEIRGNIPFKTTVPEEVIAIKELDAVAIFTAWESHVDLVIKSMEAGKYVGIEVGGAYSLDDCYRLIKTYEKTGTNCMLLENCCYGNTELAVLNMVRKGLLGEIVHCSGGYHHDLRDEVADGINRRHYRLRNYLTRNCENYPTHELGPIAKVLNINRGNRLLTLSSFASKSRGIKRFVDKHAEEFPHLVNTDFKQGDIITTVITCANGATITLTLDTSLPRPYSRGFTVRGTDGCYFEDNDMLFLDSAGLDHNKPKDHWGNAEKYKEEHKHHLWEKYESVAKEAGHDGMDYMVLSAFFEAVEKKATPPIDIYDMATWMCITPLSEESINKGGMPVSIPDFTNGNWILNTNEKSDLEFSLD